MAFTREELQAYIDDDIDSVTSFSGGTVRELCRALLAEMDKPKVWDGAPNNANYSMVAWYGKDGSVTHSHDYTRELPKSRARKIAEEEARIWRASMPSGTYLIADLIESAILKREKELEAGK